MKHVLPLAVSVLLVSSANAQMPTARPEDVGTLDGIIRAFYDVISGPAGTPRQWHRDSSLYIPRVRFVAMHVRDGRPVAAVMDHAEFVASYNRSFVDSGFFEREIHRVTKRFGNIVHIFSTYEYRTTENGPVQGRGVNSIQLYWDGVRWWIAGATWDDERPDNPIPADLLP
ncbi:MAG TPA: hypothetical protein VGQ48_10280 [Gemmatimonadales bacterium]|jgi:hypothetical protein|nr:hypothetical protein [Gemmatimonadales bacterium]